MSLRFVALGIPFFCCFLLACQSSEPSESVTGTETNWLKSCESDGDCGSYSCECGVCTLTCERDSDCGMTGAHCGAEGSAELAALCSSPPAGGKGLCLSDSSPPLDGSAPSGPPSGSLSTDDDPTPLVEPPVGPGPMDPPTVDAAVSPTPTMDPNDAAPSNTVPAAQDAGPSEQQPAVDSGLVDVEGGVELTCADEPSAPPGGCCYRDSDCEPSQNCYGSDCSGDDLTPGRCVSPPSDGQCVDDRDCPTGQYCDGGSLAACLTLGPDAIGTCKDDCDFDSCHPERCDEPGEPCCDPLPGDGVNYCNNGLACGANGCEERPETTTPEEQARLACEQTGGTWDYQSCGNYQCGLAPDCAAIIPGCNCGIAANYGTLGCVDDPTCDTASASFACGDQTCTSVGGSYCEQFTGGPGITTYTCRDIPTACLGDAHGCDCLLTQNADGYECNVGAGGQLILVPPPAP